MDIADASKTGRKFLEELDGFLAKNYPKLKCNDVRKIYFNFFDDLKDFKGNSNGFTGLAEYLIFRFLYHQLGGSFEPRDATPNIKEFVRDDLRIWLSMSVETNGNRHRPDIALWQGGNLMAVIQIKIYLTNGMKEVQKELKTFQSLRKINPRDFRALLIIYLLGKGKVRQELDKQKDKNAWFDFLILGENNEFLTEKLRTSLLLDRLTAVSPSRGNII